MAKYIVYMHRLKKDNRVYIGITCQNPKKRWQNGLGYAHSSYFYNAIMKYGWDNFEHIILYENLSKVDAEQKEVELIIKYKSNKKGYGFNLTEGGFAPTMTEEQKKKISESEKGKIVSEETRMKSSKTRKELFKKYGLTPKQKECYKRRIRPIICVETNIIYNGQKDLKEKGFNAGNVCRACSNARYTANGYHWKYWEG